MPQSQSLSPLIDQDIDLTRYFGIITPGEALAPGTSRTRAGCSLPRLQLPLATIFPSPHCSVDSTREATCDRVLPTTCFGDLDLRCRPDWRGCGPFPHH